MHPVGELELGEHDRVAWDRPEVLALGGDDEGDLQERVARAIGERLEAHAARDPERAIDLALERAAEAVEVPRRTLVRPVLL